MINSHIKGQVNFGSSQSMPNESKYTHFSATRIPTQRKNKMLWKTCPTPFQNWLVRLNFIGDASLVIPCISGTIIRSWWNMVKSYQIVSIFFLLGTFLVASRDFFLGIRQAMPLSVTKTLAFPRMNSVAGVRFGIQFVHYGYLPGKFKIDTHKKCRRFFRCVYSCLWVFVKIKFQGCTVFHLLFEKVMNAGRLFPKCSTWGQWNLTFFFLRLKGWSCQYPFSNHFYGRNPTNHD